MVICHILHVRLLMYVYCLRHIYDVDVGICTCTGVMEIGVRGRWLLPFCCVVLHAFYILIHRWIWDLELY
jgi:hypothetical protein